MRSNAWKAQCRFVSVVSKCRVKMMIVSGVSDKYQDAPLGALTPLLMTRGGGRMKTSLCN